ncbi:MAG: acetyltransferase [Campylobacterota bacterium]|nr:acetyltransferase [Campylobacterota bacterium]
MRSIYIYGASGHGLVVADIAKACGYDHIKFIDDGDNHYSTFENISKQNNIPVALGIGDNIIRTKIYNNLKKAGFKIATLISPSAIISPSAKVEEGSVVMPNVVVNAKAFISKGVILNTAAVVEHECVIEEFVHISPNCALAGDVKVDSYTHIGIGTNIIQGIYIGKNTIIGAGSTVVNNIGDNKKGYGTPCKVVQELF